MGSTGSSSGRRLPDANDGTSAGGDTSSRRSRWLVTDQPDLEHTYGYGHLNGAFGIDPDPFAEFVRHGVDEAEAFTLLGEVEREADQWRRRDESRREVERRIAGAEVELAHRRDELDRERAGRDAAAEERKDLAARLDEYRGRGSVPLGLLYLVAGGIFVAGDVAMAEITVADALEMTGWHGLVFALGLAMLAVVLKPAYERLVEEPYHEHKRVAVFRWVILGAALLGAIALGVLGAFRSVALQNAAQAEGQGVDALRELRVQLLSSDLGLVAFVLTGVLFAISGAICLSIAFKHFQDAWHLRWGTRRAMWRAGRAQRRARDRVAVLEGELREGEAELERLRSDRTSEWSLEDVRAGLDACRERRAALIPDILEARRHELDSLYRNGYDIGMRDPEAIIGDRFESSGGRARRPYLALRDAIRESTSARA